jgi:hypothetical protein
MAVNAKHKHIFVQPAESASRGKAHRQHEWVFMESPWEFAES